MRVLVNAISARRGGIVTYSANLIDALRSRGFDALFAVPPEIARTRPESSLTVAASGYGGFRRFAWEQAVWRRRVKAIAPDVLFSSANFGLIRSPVPQVLLLREGGLFDPFYLANTAPAQGASVAIVRHFRRRLMLMSAQQADHVIVPSEALRDMVVRWSPGISAKCSVNPYGTLPGLYRPAASPRAWRADGILRLIFVSVYYPHKNPAVLCAAVDRLQAEGTPAHATITMDIAETRVPGGAGDRIALRAGQANGSVSLGHREYRELPALYREHDVFVFPSVSETFGHPMAEALATGLPIVAADTAINREICGDAALYFRPFAPADLARQLRALDADPALRERLRRGAVERGRVLYDWDGHVDRLVATFENVAWGKRTAALPAAAE